MNQKTIFKNGVSATLFQGDCLQILPTFPPGIIDAVICDPPYGTTACKWDSVIPFAPMWAALNHVTKERAAIVLFGSEPFSSALRMSNIKNYKYDWVWEKPRGTGHLNAKKQPMRYTELVSVFYAKQCTYNPQKTTGHKPVNMSSTKTCNPTELYGKFEKIRCGGNTDRYPKNILRFNHTNNIHGTLHPTQKPVALMEYFVRTYTNPGDTVLDFTHGSGTTGVACILNGRNFYGIENDPGYFQISIDRMASI